MLIDWIQQMKPQIFYFTGTGNTYFVAKRVAERLNGELLPIQNQLSKTTIDLQSDTVGIIFPIYYATLPNIIEQFIKRLVTNSEIYLFSICTYGGGPGDSTKKMKLLLSSKKITLSAVFGIHMRQNAFLKFWENTENINRNAQKKIERICKRIQLKKKGQLLSGRIWNCILSPMNGLLKKASIEALSKISGSSTESDYQTIIHKADTSFKSNSDCNGCGTCIKVCPMKNIILENNRPVWTNKCENCLACYNWCPKKAIEGAIAKKGYFYTNPEVKIKDISSN